jgi:hypothetical protein
MVIFPSPAEGSIKPAAAGVQALTMNSPGSAWTPVLAGLKQLICRRRQNPKPKPARYTLYRTGTKYRSGHQDLCSFQLDIRRKERISHFLPPLSGQSALEGYFGALEQNRFRGKLLVVTIGKI